MVAWLCVCVVWCDSSRSVVSHWLHNCDNWRPTLTHTHSGFRDILCPAMSDALRLAKPEESGKIQCRRSFAQGRILAADCLEQNEQNSQVW